MKTLMSQFHTNKKFSQKTIIYMGKLYRLGIGLLSKLFNKNKLDYFIIYITE